MRASLPFLLYAMAVVAHLFLCRLIIVHQAQIPRGSFSIHTIVEATALSAPDALAVAAMLALTLAIARLSAAAAMLFMAVAAGFLMLAAAVNVGVMRVYHQPATINLLGYGDFLHLPGLLSLSRYASRADKVALALALLLTASFALLPRARKSRLLDRPVVARAVIAAALAAVVAPPLYGLVRGGQIGQARHANAGWWLVKSVVAPPIGRAAEVRNPDLDEPFETYAAGRERWITSPKKIRDAGIRNVLVVVLESVGTEYLDPAAAPNLSRLKGQSAYFPNTFAPMASSPMSLFSLMSGMYPPVSPRAIPMVEPEFPATTVLEALGSSGRRTAVFSANWGFMDFRRYLRRRIRFLEEAPDERGEGEAGTFDSLKRWVSQSDEPFAAMLWTYGTHYPYGADASQIAGKPQLAKRLYTKRLGETDRLLGELFAWLQSRGSLDETLVVIVGDHGEAFLQHDTLSHGNDIYGETIRVPLMLVNRQLFSGTADPSPVRIIDVAPTVLTLAGVTVPETFQGVDLSSPLRPRRVYFAAAWLNLVMGFQDERMKYIYSYVTDRLQAFDVERDPKERMDFGPRLTQAERKAAVHRIMNWKAAVEAKTQAVRSYPRRR